MRDPSRISPKSMGRRSGIATRSGDGVAIDRKSTRLNSSHSQISYAVFCLKKKNKKSHASYMMCEYYSWTLFLRFVYTMPFCSPSIDFFIRCTVVSQHRSSHQSHVVFIYI